jgi:hypothetical protein
VHELEHRRDREARAGEVLDREDEADHGPQVRGTITSSIVPSGSAK